MIVKKQNKTVPVFLIQSHLSRVIPGHFRCLSKVFYGEESKSVNSRRVTFMSNAGSKQTSENLVDNVLCQLKKA